MIQESLDKDRIKRVIFCLIAGITLTMMGAPPLSALAGEPGSTPDSQKRAKQLTDQFFLSQQSSATIACGEMKQGRLDPFDQTFTNGVHFDAYDFTLQQPNQPFIVTAQSSDFPVQSAVFFFDAHQQQFIHLQAGVAGVEDRQIQYSGILVEPGRYRLVVNADGPQSLGSYTVSYECSACSGTAGACPDILPTIQEVTCELTSAFPLQDEQGNIHFFKLFGHAVEAGSTCIRVDSQSFTPVLSVADANSGENLAAGSSPLQVNSTQARQLVILISSEEPERTGTFTVVVTPTRCPKR